MEATESFGNLLEDQTQHTIYSWAKMSLQAIADERDGHKLLNFQMAIDEDSLPGALPSYCLAHAG